MLVVISVALIAAAYGRLATPVYTAQATLKIDPKGTVLNGGAMQDVPSGAPDQAVIETEVAVLRSPALALQVVRTLRLGSEPELTRGMEQPWGAGGRAARERAVADRVLMRLDVRRQRATYLVDIAFRSAHPALAARVANGFAEAYLRTTADRRTGTAEAQFRSLDRRLNELGRQAQAADAAVAHYRASAGIAASANGITVTDQQIAPLSGQLATAQAAAAAAQSDLSVARQQMASGGASAASSVLNSPAIQQLRANRASVQQTLSQLGTRYGPRHPQTIQAEQQLQAIDMQMQEEASRIVGELETHARASSAQAGSLTQALAGLRGQQAANARSQVTADSLQREAEAKRSAYNRVAQVMDQVNQLARSSLSQAQVVNGAEVPDRPSAPNRPRVMAIGIGAGAILGILAIVALEMLASGFVSVQQLEQVLGVKMLASVPRLSGRDMGRQVRSPADTLVGNPVSFYAEAFRSLRGSLSTPAGQPAKVVALVSTLPAEGKTTCALSLARMMALAGEKTLVVDCDIRRAGITALSQRPARAGLIEVLTAGAKPADAIVPDVVPGLDMLVVSGPTFTPADIFGTPGMRELLALLGRHYHRIVLDTPPILGVTDARTLAGLADAVVLVVKWQSTTRKAAQAAADWLKRDGVPIAGTLMTMVSRHAEAYGALYHSARYADYYRKA